MFDQLDDTQPFIPGTTFRTAVTKRARRARRRRAALRIGGATCALAVIVPAALVLYEYRRIDDIPRISIPSVGDHLPLETIPATTSVLAPQTASSAGASTGTTVGADALADSTTFLIVGVDARSDEPEVGSRSDTIMLLRVDPTSRQMHLLSIPRDLWIDIPSRSGKARINSVMRDNDPEDLVVALEQNFDVSIDHYVQVDFEGFAALVDLAGGVSVRSNVALRDSHTGLALDGGRCVTMNGQQALTLVRSRHTQFFDGATWTEDPRSDIGRIDRQQVFLRALAGGLLGELDDPSSIHDFISVAADSLVLDSGLSTKALISSAMTLRNIGIDRLQTSTVEATGTVIDAMAVLEPSAQQLADAASFLANGNPTSQAGAPTSRGDDTAITTSTTTPARVPAGRPSRPTLEPCTP